MDRAAIAAAGSDRAAEASATRAWLRAPPAARALVALALVTGAGSGIVAKAEPIVRAALALFGVSADGTSLGLGFAFILPLAIVALALVGGLVCGVRFRVGREDPLLASLALPLGVAVMVVVLLPVGFVGGIGEGAAMGADPLILLEGSFAVLLGAFAEELLLRGALQPVLARAWGLWPALLLSAISFALIHLAGGWFDQVSLGNIVLGSLWFGLLRARTGGLLAPVLAHFGYNWVEEMLFGISPNPGVGPFGALFDLDLIGGPRLGGSPEGMNASPILTVVLLLVVALLVADMRRRPGTGAGEGRVR